MGGYFKEYFKDELEKLCEHPVKYAGSFVLNTVRDYWDLGLAVFSAYTLVEYSIPIQNLEQYPTALFLGTAVGSAVGGYLTNYCDMAMHKKKLRKKSKLSDEELNKLLGTTTGVGGAFRIGRNFWGWWSAYACYLGLSEGSAFKYPMGVFGQGFFALICDIPWRHSSWRQRAPVQSIDDTVK